jgi:hypothetical protein
MVIAPLVWPLWLVDATQWLLIREVALTSVQSIHLVFDSFWLVAAIFMSFNEDPDE